jgi:hypothetical protein
VGDPDTLGDNLELKETFVLLKVSFILFLGD